MTTKRILSVSIKRMWDDSPDTSYLEQPEFEERKESYKNGDFSFIGIQAEASIGVGDNLDDNIRWHTQTITSGGLWSIESDSDKGHFKSVEKEELSDLREQLKAIGFSTRAISSAFKNVEREGV
jgi:hypothetical protein